MSLAVQCQLHAARLACQPAETSAAESPYVLMVGDLSGIQDFIFNIASVNVGGGVARRLRARSLYVQLLTEIAALRCLNLCTPALPLCNVLMSSGGKFFVLLPNTAAVHTAWPHLQQEIDAWLLETFHGEIGVTLTAVPFGDAGFRAGTGGCGDLLSQADALRQVMKQQVYRNTLASTDGWHEECFIRATAFSGEQLCRSCRKHPAGSNGLCVHCVQSQQVGATLPRARYIAFYASPSQGEMPLLGWSVSITDTCPTDAPTMLWHLNSYAIAALPTADFRCVFLSTHLPLDGDEVMTFEQMADTQTGQPLLAHLKADVDRMGQVLAFGLKREPESHSLDSMARIMEMSSSLDVFFAGYLTAVLHDPAYRFCYTVFSGGDDLYVIGPREMILEFAGRLRQDFHRYTGNPHLTLSAGIALCKPKFPVATAAGMADAALEEAKTAGRDRLAILGQVLPWADAQKMLRWYRLLKPVLTDKSNASALLHRLLRYAHLAERTDTDPRAWRYQALIEYDRRRNLQREDMPNVKRMSDWYRALTNTSANAAPNDDPPIDMASVIVRLAMMERREGS
ncbi:MAG TPA: type III-A CRISPR-associated protein Cas10/Csm1 [Armatimonadota bacterium]|nr:type III-A CRISPR-associated protein Cas10/Csm1 [Armatimonadota bacterium]